MAHLLKLRQTMLCIALSGLKLQSTIVRQLWTTYPASPMKLRNTF